MSALAWATPVIAVVTIVGVCQLGHVALRYWPPPWWLTQRRVHHQQPGPRARRILQDINPRPRHTDALDTLIAATANATTSERARRDQEWAHLRNTCHIPDEPWWTDFAQGHEETTP